MSCSELIDSVWLRRLEKGDDDAARRIWELFATKLAAIAGAKLGNLVRELDGEDIALSAIKSLVIGAREKRFPQLADPGSLWPLLVTLTVRKSISARRRSQASKRNVHREFSLDQVCAYLEADPGGALIGELKDELSHLYAALGEPRLKKIVELRLSGHSIHEIADQLGCVPRTVLRKTKLIRAEWIALSERDSETTDFSGVSLSPAVGRMRGKG